MGMSLVGAFSNDKRGFRGRFSALLLGTDPFLLGKGSQLDPQQRHHFQSGLQECQREGQFFPDMLGETEEKKGQNFCTPSFLVVTACRYAGTEGRDLEGSGTDMH